MKRDVKTFLFDLDGTLLDSEDSVINTYAQSLLRMGVTPPPRAVMRKFLGPSAAENFAPYVGEERVAEAIANYRHFYSTQFIFQAKTFAGVGEMLAALQAKGKQLIVVTSKLEQYAKPVLAHYGYAKYLTAIYGAVPEEGRNKKRDILAHVCRVHALTPADTMMVGDRDNDIISAKHNGIECIGVLWGYGPEAELREAGAVALVQKPEELLVY